MRHLLADFLAARLAGVGGNEADLPHLGGPWLVVVATPRRLALMVLPQMHHLVHERGQRFRGRAGGEVGRVQGDFVGDLLRVGNAGEALAREIPVSTLVPLHGDQAVRELAAEQLPVEMIIRGVQAGIGSWSGRKSWRCPLWWLCIVRYNINGGRYKVKVCLAWRHNQATECGGDFLGGASGIAVMGGPLLDILAVSQAGQGQYMRAGRRGQRRKQCRDFGRVLLAAVAGVAENNDAAAGKRRPVGELWGLGSVGAGRGIGDAKVAGDVGTFLAFQDGDRRLRRGGLDRG